MIPFNVVLFDDFETLDAFGPIEIIGKMPKTYKLGCFTINGGTALSSQQVSVNARSFSEIDTTGVLLIPGGIGTRKLVEDVEYIWNKDKSNDLIANELYKQETCTN